LEIIILTARN